MKEITINLSSGAVYKVERQRIKTSFCYGYGFCGVSNAEEDKHLIIEGLELEKASFIKRLNTYLKRYGLSKVRTWSYLVD